MRITPELDPQTPGRDLADAWRVYERLGFSPGFFVYHGKRPRS